jgi:hypothetical protein
MVFKVTVGHLIEDVGQKRKIKPVRANRSVLYSSW